MAPAVSRVGQSLALSVMKETAPFQLSTDVARIEVNQGRQILLPLKLVRRNGFDGDVTMALAGLPIGNLNIQNKAFPKGQSEELLRMLVARGTRPGTYAIYWNLQAPVSYRRNVFALERAEREQTAAAKAAVDATAQAKAAGGLKEQATKKLAELAAAIKPLKTRATELERTLADAQRRYKSLAENKAKPKSAAMNQATALAETTARVADVARKSAGEAEANVQSASESARPELKARAAAARQLAAELQKSADEAAAKARPAGAAPTGSNKQPSLADFTKLVAESETAHHRLTDAEASLKSATEAKKQADAEAAAAQARSQQLAAAKSAADTRLAQAKQTAAPQAMTDFPPSTPILLTVKAAPFEVSASVAKGGKLKRGEQVDVRVKVRRTRAFKGPVTLGLPLPPGVIGIKAGAVTIPAQKSEAVLRIAAEKTAKPGPVANLVVRGAAQFEGQAEVDAPITLQVNP
jgi:predicted transcriptional regulator